LKKNLIKLLVSLSLISNLSYAETTNNLVSQDFTTGWSGTNLSSLHGSNTIAGVHNGYVESDAVSLNSQDINKESLNEGFTVTGSANYWFWSGAQQSVTQTIKTVDDNGNIITQTRVVSGTSGTGTTYDQLIIGSNSQQDYDVSLRYDFSIPTYPSYHYAADLSNPSLSVTYSYKPPMDAATQTALLDLNKTITDDLKDVKEVKIESKTVDNKIEMTSTEPQLETQSDSLSSTDSKALSDEKTDAPLSQVSDSQDPQEPQSVEDEPSLQAEQKSSEEQDTETETSTEKEQTTEVASDNKSNVSGEKKSVSLAKSMDKIDAQVKDIGKNLQLKNLVTLKIMSNNDVLQQYANTAFYKPKKIYENQLNIADNRVLYPDSTLISYTQNDPIFTKEKEIYNIRLQKQKLINEIKALTNG